MHNWLMMKFGLTGQRGKVWQVGELYVCMHNASSLEYKHNIC